MKTLKTLFFLLCSFSISAQFTNPKFVYSEFTYPVKDVCVADFDLDGYPDLAFGSNVHLTWSKNLQQKDQWAANEVIDPVDLSNRKIEAVDFDEDGWMDIVAIGESDADSIYLNWFRNEGYGQFSEAIAIETFPLSTSANKANLEIYVEDIDQDGHADILALVNSYINGTDNIIWYRGDGQGSTSERLVLNPTNFFSPTAIHLGDVNLDGFLDLMVIDDKQEFVFFENNEGIDFKTPQTLITNSSEYIHLGVADIDGNGTQDIYAGASGGQDIRWFSQTSPGVFDNTQHRINANPYSINKVIPADIDGDGLRDLVFATSANKMGFVKNLDGLGNYADPVLLWDEAIAPIDNSLLEVVDWDNDNDLDIIYSGYEIFENLLFENTDGQGNFVSNQLFTMGPGGYFQEQEFGDIDNDGHFDVIIADEQLSWMRYNPYFDLFERVRFIPTSVSPSQLVLMDINKDGVQDVVYSSLDQDDVIFWRLNNGIGEFSSEQMMAYDANNYLQLYAEDLNGDGWEDLVVCSGNPAGGGIFWYKNLQSTSGDFAAAEFLENNSVNRITFADVDDNGTLDLLPTFQTSDLGWIKNNGTSFEPWLSLVDNSTYHNEVIFDDVDNDGKKDLLINAIGRFIYFKQQDNLVFEDALTIPNSGAFSYNFYYIDYDLDGFKDLLFRVSDSQLLYKKNTNDSNLFASPEVIDLGLQFYQRLRFQDLDNDSDLDMIYKDYHATYFRTNISANGKISAKAFYDKNNNGSYEADEPTLNHIQFGLIPDETIHYTSNNQEHRFFVHEGNYVLKSFPKTGWNLTTGSADCPIEFIRDTTIDKQFGFFPATLSTAITPNLSSAATRCGFTVPFWLSYENDGTTIENGWLALAITDNATFLSASITPDSVSNDTLFWSFLELPPTQKSTIQLLFEIEGVNALGDSVRMTANTYTLENTDWLLNQSYSFASVIDCAYDPNDKQVEPAGLLDEHYTRSGETLYYTVRFQNTGTDTAFQVSITDVLDPNLNLASFQLIASSHLVEISLTESDRTLQFDFPNILLPDSLTNETRSHGFVQFKIKPHDNLPDGTRIENEANIFFDFNPPILTNHTWNTLVETFAISATADIQEPLCQGDLTGNIALTVAAIPPLSYTWNDPNLSGPNLTNLPAGNYSLTLTDGLGQSTTFTYTLNEPSAIAASLTASPQSNIALGTATINLTGGTPPYSITWNTTPPQNGPTATNLIAGIYQANVIDANGCSYTGSIEVPLSTHLNNVDELGELSISPNPTTGKLYLPNISYKDLKLVDQLGQTVLQAPGTPTVLDLSHLPLGMYFLLLKREEDWISFKVLKQ